VVKRHRGHRWAPVFSSATLRRVTENPRARRTAILTVDLEDYRRQELRDHLGHPQPANPAEVERQVDLLLELFDGCEAAATFFSVGRLVGDLPRAVWGRVTARHRLGCHGHEHLRVSEQGRPRFKDDLAAAKGALEDAAGVPVVSFRAPYFSADGCDPWFGQVLAGEGFRLDSSRRYSTKQAGAGRTVPLEGSQGRVTELPLCSLGVGAKRLTVIGGTYFRLLPLPVIERLLGRAEALGFVPVIYLHPYDVDPSAAPLAYPPGHLKERGGDWMRRRGRASAGEKLRALAQSYVFRAAETLVS
jgi:peptidoglycan/xylan/chitin deacetylase (PgdA/CDA1 family)